MACFRGGEIFVRGGAEKMSMKMLMMRKLKRKRNLRKLTRKLMRKMKALVPTRRT